jgi:hypothetical protein
MNSKLRQWILLFVVILVVAALFAACNRDKEEAAQPAPQQSSATNGGGEGSAAGGGLPASAMEIAAARELTPADIEAALKTYVPSGKWDEYMMFASGGHSGNLIVIGIPSMRILKQVAVFTPESWQGYGYGELGTEGVLDGGNVDGETIRMGTRRSTAASSPCGNLTGRRAVSTTTSPSASKCRPIGKICATRASWPATAGPSVTRSTRKWPPAVWKAATRPSRRA